MKKLTWTLYQIPGEIYFLFHKNGYRKLAVLTSLLFDYSGFTFVTYRLSRIFQ